MRTITFFLHNLGVIATLLCLNVVQNIYEPQINGRANICQFVCQSVITLGCRSNLNGIIEEQIKVYAC